MDEDNLSGIWRSTYRYTSVSRGPGEYESEHYVVMRRQGAKLVVASLPNTEGSYLMLNLTLDGPVATGTWQETASPRKHFQGMTYGGAVQMVLDPEGKRMAGLWLGVSRKLFVKDGVWELVRIGKAAPELPAK